MQLVVDTTNGLVQGRERNGVALFAGIPYAAPPVGDLRWAPPQPASPWADTRDATRFGKAAPQLPGDGMTNSAPIAWDEDCLTVNVCTPNADDGDRAVLVWIHGGAYRHGTGATPWYDGTSFATRGDIVVVSINYRLGALGFCAVPGEATAGIAGTLDQIAALHWVQDNIERFGGDPDRVTIAGESAGAFSVATLTSMPEANHLFSSVIAQSGAGHHVHPAKTAADVAQALMEELGVDNLESARACTTMEVLEAQARVESRSHEFMGRVGQPFYPSVTPNLLPDHPIDLMRAGAGAHVRMLTGTNQDEMTLFGLGAVDEDGLAGLLRHYVDPPDELIAAYREHDPDIDAAGVAVALTTDHTFRIPAIRMAEARHGRGAATWMYLFDWKSKAFGGALGATHALEIPFMFNTLDRPGVDVFLGTTELPHELADAMHDAWIAFVNEGTPHTEMLARWPEYRPTDRHVMCFADEVALVDDPDGATREAWDGVPR